MAIDYLNSAKVCTSTLSSVTVTIPSTKTVTTTAFETPTINVGNSSIESFTKNLCELAQLNVMFLAYASQFRNH